MTDQSIEEAARAINAMAAAQTGGTLTAAQMIRLHVFMSLTNERTETDEIRDVLAMVVRAGGVIETGELDDDEAYTADAAHELACGRLYRIRHVLDAVGASLPASDLHDLRAALEWEPEECGEHDQPEWGMDRPASVRVTDEDAECSHPQGCVRTGSRFRCGGCQRVLCSMHVGRNKAGDHPGGMACVPPQVTGSDEQTPTHPPEYDPSRGVVDVTPRQETN